jgi:hypothetical protein
VAKVRITVKLILLGVNELCHGVNYIVAITTVFPAASLAVIVASLIKSYYVLICRCQWPSGQRPRTEADRLLELRFRIPPGA